MHTLDERHPNSENQILNPPAPDLTHVSQFASSIPGVPESLKEIKEFQDCCNTAKIIFVERNEAYGASYKTGGLMLVLAEIRGIVGRLTKMVLRDFVFDQTIKVDKIRDALLDLHNYANIGIMLLEDNNIIGTDL